LGVKIKGLLFFNIFNLLGIKVGHYIGNYLGRLDLIRGNLFYPITFTLGPSFKRALILGATFKLIPSLLAFPKTFWFRAHKGNIWGTQRFFFKPPRKVGY